MQITLDDAEINRAITDCIANQGVDVHDKNVVVTFKSGRKGKDGKPGSGNTAMVEITEKEESANAVAAPDFGKKAVVGGSGES